MEFGPNIHKHRYKPMTSRPNEEPVRNVLNREFQVVKEMSVLVSDLTSKLFHTDEDLNLRTLERMSY
ncbi:hypothetical protein [Bacillus sp. FSL K6-3431]|uniref:hypothetical protein n=1 Tax=Bacillus sp. FSL K6-3431 TaxID=2921500 RepID=UPI0030FC799D